MGSSPGLRCIVYFSVWSCNLENISKIWYSLDTHAIMPYKWGYFSGVILTIARWFSPWPLNILACALVENQYLVHFFSSGASCFQKFNFQGDLRWRKCEGTGPAARRSSNYCVCTLVSAALGQPYQSTYTQLFGVPGLKNWHKDTEGGEKVRLLIR